jgi:hypothetical protein
MTMAYDPHHEWTDGLTHADTERIRRDCLAWAADFLRKEVAGYAAAATAFDEHQDKLGRGRIDGTWRQLRLDRDVAAYRVVGAAESLLRYAPDDNGEADLHHYRSA